MFQFRRFPSYTYLIQCRILEYCSSGFPHSEIPGSKLVCSSPRLIAASHVLHRLLVPRHSPCALISLTFCKRFLEMITSSSFTVRCLNYAGSQIGYHCSLLPIQSGMTVCSTNLKCFTSLLLARKIHLLSNHIVQFSRCSFWSSFPKIRFQYPITWILKSNLWG